MLMISRKYIFNTLGFVSLVENICLEYIILQNTFNKKVKNKSCAV